MSLRFVLIQCLIILFLFIQSANAWQSHFLITYPILKGMQEISQEPTIRAETLSAFLEAESEKLVPVLKNIDSLSGKMGYLPPLDFNLIFRGKIDPQKRTLLEQFTDCARIHPQGALGMHYDTLFVEYPPNSNHRIHNPLPLKNVVLGSIIREVPIANPPLEKVNPGEYESPLEIISSAVDEPDFGMDINLWEDNHTSFELKYKLGKTPDFTNKDLAISTQAPFHMGFYYEPYIIRYLILPSIKQSYPEHRIHFFITLSQFAFKEGHPYWGYRFLGWAIHYLQDLSQPYHSKLAPGYSTAYLMLGFPDRVKVKNVLTNKHLALENYQYNVLKNVLNKKTKSQLVNVLMDSSHDNNKIHYNHLYPRNVVAKEAYHHADKFNASLTKVFSKIANNITKKSDGFSQNQNVLNFGSIDTDIYAKVDQNNSEVQVFNKELAILFRATAEHTRKIIRYAKKQEVN